MLNAWQYLVNYGVVSEACLPYASQSGVAPKCATSCTGTGSWNKYKCVKGSYVAPTTYDAMKLELSTNGPLEGAFSVYEDFFNYASGVYH